MYKVLIVDDVREIRTGIRLRVEWNRFHFEVAGEAGNGEEALERLLEEPYDVVITDIQMPVMNGLALLRECSSSYPHIRLIVLSGYDDFAYVKTAIQCGAADYLLKPVVTEELEQLLERVGKQLDEDNVKKTAETELRRKLADRVPAMREQFVLQLIKEDGLSAAETRRRAGELGMGAWLDGGTGARILSAELRVPDNRFERVSERPELMRTAFQLMCREIAQKSLEPIIAFYDMNYPAMVHFFAAFADEDRLVAFASKLQRDIHHFLRVGVVAGIGQAIPDASRMKNGYATSLLALSRIRLDTHSHIGFAHDSEQDRELPSDLEKRITAALEKGNGAAYASLVDELLRETESYSKFSFNLAVLKVMFAVSAVVRKFRIEDARIEEALWDGQQALWKLEAAESVKSRLLLLGGIIADQVNRVKRSRSDEIVDAVCRYMDDNYGEEISLAGFAEQYRINTAYLSDVFHKQTGKTYSEYLLDVRMRHAEALLREGRLSISDVALRVGFSNLSYFSTIFKRTHGVRPADFRKNQKKL
ncbi:response regulator transcription factor [Paenibacillus arenilitoris]|uniref:Response regulator n=1 Tax=Paenibacillus arenilitoris TaxID=2772299 RepID=A0A927CPT4_9BACL|nr:response regulator [Paenibacillus arenilitoris]MBD2870578.1 response regulator [Paenibacillus arenilitoris]